MNNVSIYDELDQAIESLLQPQHAQAQPASSSQIAQSAPNPGALVPEAADETSDVRELAQVARDLRDLPRENFKSRLRLELEWEAAGRVVTSDAAQQAGHRGAEALPSLLGKNWSGYPVRRSHFALSAALHAVMLLAIGAGLVAVKSLGPQMDTHRYVSSRIEPPVFPVGRDESHGGGSGGAADKIPASHGAVRMSREQLAPPIILQTDTEPKLAVQPTVAAPPELSAMKMKQPGDPLSLLAKASNGAGVHGGFGGHTGTGVGTGDGSGFGSGSDGGCCSGVYAAGHGGVSMPRPIYTPEPEFSEEARRVKLQGEVTLLAIIGVDGRPRNLEVVRSLGYGLDQKALAAVTTWRFEPAKKDGHAVAVQMSIIVNFHLY
jgi:periplasmic protein TonB